MKPFKLSPKFYIIFSLLFAIPASFIATSFQNYLSTVNHSSILYKLATLGIIEAPTTILLLIFTFWLIDTWLWRIKGLSFILGIPNDINGRYEGELVSNYDGNKTYTIVIEIKQSLNKILLNLYTENSTSYSMIATIGKNNKNNWAVSYIYQNNTTTVNHDEDMRDHSGTAFLEILDNGSKLKGSYFNNSRERGRYGTIDVNFTGKKLLGCFK